MKILYRLSPSLCGLNRRKRWRSEMKLDHFLRAKLPDISTIIGDWKNCWKLSFEKYSVFVRKTKGILNNDSLIDIKSTEWKNKWTILWHFKKEEKKLDKQSRISGRFIKFDRKGRKSFASGRIIYIYMSGNRGKCGRMRFEGELRLKVE